MIDIHKFYVVNGVTCYSSDYIIPNTLLRLPITIFDVVSHYGVTQEDLVCLNESDFRFKIFCARRSAFGAYGSSL